MVEKEKQKVDRDSRKGVEEGFKYLLFDIYADLAREGKLTLEQAMIEYMIEVTWAEHEL